jgi:hypothetical protein
MNVGLPAQFLTFLLDPKVIHFCVSAAALGQPASAGRDLCFRLPSNCTRNCTAAQRFVGPVPLHFPKGIFKIGFELVDWHSEEQAVRCVSTPRAPTTHTKACTINEKQCVFFSLFSPAFDSLLKMIRFATGTDMGLITLLTINFYSKRFFPILPSAPTHPHLLCPQYRPQQSRVSSLDPYND